MPIRRGAARKIRASRPWQLAIVAVLACTGSDQAPPAPQSDTPAGEIVTLIPADSIVTVGVTVGDEAYQLDRVTDAMRLSDGTLVIGNCQSAELRLFDEDGVHIRTVGGEGQGPGEFMWLKRIFPAGGDSIGVLDGRLRRLTIFTPEGDMVRTIRLGSQSEVVGRLQDGSFVAIHRTSSGFEPPPGETGPFRVPATIYRLDGASGEPVDSIAGLPGYEAMIRESGPMRIRRPKLGPVAVFAVFPDGVVYGAQGDDGFIEFDVDLQERTTFPARTRTEPVTEELEILWQEMRDDRLLIPEGSCCGTAWGSAFTETMPAYRDVLPGRDGTLWVEDPYRLPFFPLTWTGYRDGSPVARVELPPRFFAFEFGLDYVVGLTYDELLVERVHVLPLVSGELPMRELTPQEAEPPISWPMCGAWAAR